MSEDLKPLFEKKIQISLLEKHLCKQYLEMVAYELQQLDPDNNTGAIEYLGEVYNIICGK